MKSITKIIAFVIFCFACNDRPKQYYSANNDTLDINSIKLMSKKANKSKYILPDFRIESINNVEYFYDDNNGVQWSDPIDSKITLIYKSKQKTLLVYFNRSIFKKYDNVMYKKNIIEKGNIDEKEIVLYNSHYGNIVTISSLLMIEIRFYPNKNNNYYQMTFFHHIFKNDIFEFN